MPAEPIKNVSLENMPIEKTPLEVMTDELFANCWQEARDDLLQRSDLFTVMPGGTSSPSDFRFTINRPFKPWTDTGLEFADGPISGVICYRRDALAPALPDEIPLVAVVLDPWLRFAHPNVHPDGYVCLGDLRGMVPLQQLLIYLVSLLSYQTFKATDPVNRQVAELFAVDPEEALRGIPPMEPLW